MVLFSGLLCGVGLVFSGVDDWCTGVVCMLFVCLFYGFSVFISELLCS